MAEYFRIFKLPGFDIFSLDILMALIILLIFNWYERSGKSKYCMQICCHKKPDQAFLALQFVTFYFIRYLMKSDMKKTLSVLHL